MRVAALQVPEVMQVTIRENNESAIPGTGITAGLFFANQRLFILGLGFQND